MLYNLKSIKYTWKYLEVPVLLAQHQRFRLILESIQINAWPLLILPILNQKVNTCKFQRFFCRVVVNKFVHLIRYKPELCWTLFEYTPRNFLYNKKIKRFDFIIWEYISETKKNRNMDLPMTGNKFELNCSNSGVNVVEFWITTNHSSNASSKKYICDGSSLFVLNAMTG